MEVAVTMPSSSHILERLRWKVGLGLVIVAAGFAAQAAPSGVPSHDVARSSWGLMAEPREAPRQVLDAPADPATDVARSSWGKAAAEVADEA
jgi:hypothetical protein